jgi:hypothetical protein
MRESRIFSTGTSASAVTVIMLFVAVLSAIADERTNENRKSDRDPAPQPAASEKTTSPAAIATAVSRLGAGQFEIREEATKQLGRAGIAAIDPLFLAAEGENLEVTWRAVKALGRILDTDDESTFDAAEGALERLETSANRSAARRAVAALETQPARRWKRGLARFEALGGWSILRKGMEPARQQPTEIDMPTYLVIGPDWKGGAAGLMNIKRMDSYLQLRPADRRIGVYVIDGCNIAPQAIEEMQHALRFMEFASRGRARLAVSFTYDLRGRASEVSSIEPDAADLTKANLMTKDVIVKYDGETLIDFDHLTRITRRHEVGDKLPVEVSRNGEQFEIEIELTGWKKPENPPKDK